MDIRESVSKFQTADKRTDELLHVPQKRQSPFEIALYSLVPLLLIMAGAMPSTAVFIVPFVLPLLYLLYRRFGMYLPFCCVLFYGVFALVFNYDLITIVSVSFLLFALFGLVFSLWLKHYLLCVTVAALFAVAGMGVGVGLVRAASGEPLEATCIEYFQAESDDAVIAHYIESAYDGAELPSSVVKLERGDEGYDEAVYAYIDTFVETEFLPYVPYYCLHIGAVYALVAFLLASALNGNTSCALDHGAVSSRLPSSTRCLGGTRPSVRLSAMKIPRAYLWSVALPALVVSVILDIVGGFDILSATVMHAFVTLPSAFAFFTLLLYFASLFKGRANVAATCVAVVVVAVNVIFPVVMFFCSVVGLCDVILDLRRVTEYLRG